MPEAQHPLPVRDAADPAGARRRTACAAGASPAASATSRCGAPGFRTSRRDISAGSGARHTRRRMLPRGRLRDERHGERCEHCEQAGVFQLGLSPSFDRATTGADYHVGARARRARRGRSAVWLCACRRQRSSPYRMPRRPLGERLGHLALKAGDQALAVRQQPAALDEARADAPLDGLDERRVLQPDLVVEGDQLPRRLVVDVRRRRSSRGNRPSGRATPARPGRSRGSASPGTRSPSVPARRGGTRSPARRPARGRTGSRRGPSPSSTVRVGVDVDQAAEARMRDRAVVALEVVLDRDLPVRRRARTRPARGRRASTGSTARRELAERLGERRRVRVGVDEEERPPRLEPERHERQAGAVEAGLAVGARRRRGAPVEPVRPRVVRALERLPAPLARDDLASRGGGRR